MVTLLNSNVEPKLINVFSDEKQRLPKSTEAIRVFFSLMLHDICMHYMYNSIYF